MAENITIKLNNKHLKSFQRETIERTSSPCIFPASFVLNDDLIFAAFSTQGYRPLMSLTDMKTLALIRIIRLIIKSIFVNKNYLLQPSDYDLSADYLYINKGFDDVKWVFIPTSHQIKNESFFINLLEEIKNIGNENGIRYIDKIIDYIETSKPDEDQLIEKIDKFCKEIYQCLIE